MTALDAAAIATGLTHGWLIGALLWMPTRRRLVAASAVGALLAAAHLFGLLWRLP